MKSTFLALVAFFGLSGWAFAQESMLVCTDSSFCIPSVIGLPRSKGLEIKREIVRDYRITSTAIDGSGSAEAEIQRNRRWEMTLRVPILNKPGFKMAAGFKYFVEEYNFEDKESISFPFYQNLEDRPLRSLRGTLYLVKPTRTNKYFLLRLTGGFNGDYRNSLDDNERYLRFSISPLIGWKRTDYLSYALGFAYNYSFGRRTIYPLFAYNRTFNNHWGVESILPVSIKLRYNTTNQKNYFFLKTELNGANYNVHLDPNQASTRYLEKSEVRFLLNYEREIHDWLWFGVEAGVRQNINFDLTDSPEINARVITENNLNIAFVYNMSIFVVPPRKFLGNK